MINYYVAPNKLNYLYRILNEKHKNKLRKPKIQNITEEILINEAHWVSITQEVLH